MPCHPASKSNPIPYPKRDISCAIVSSSYTLSSYNRLVPSFCSSIHDEPHTPLVQFLRHQRFTSTSSYASSQPQSVSIDPRGENIKREPDSPLHTSPNPGTTADNMFELCYFSGSLVRSSFSSFAVCRVVLLLLHLVDRIIKMRWQYTQYNHNCSSTATDISIWRDQIPTKTT